MLQRLLIQRRSDDALRIRFGLAAGCPPDRDPAIMSLVEPKKAVLPHLARVEPISDSRVLVSDAKAQPTPASHSASDSRLTVIEPCLPPRCAEIVRTIVSGWPSALPTREREISCLTWRELGRGWL